jgi:hypothetical protein
MFDQKVVASCGIGDTTATFAPIPAACSAGLSLGGSGCRILLLSQAPERLGTWTAIGSPKWFGQGTALKTA